MHPDFLIFQIFGFFSTSRCLDLQSFRFLDICTFRSFNIWLSFLPSWNSNSILEEFRIFHSLHYSAISQLFKLFITARSFSIARSLPNIFQIFSQVIRSCQFSEIIRTKFCRNFVKCILVTRRITFTPAILGKLILENLQSTGHIWGYSTRWIFI